MAGNNRSRRSRGKILEEESSNPNDGKRRRTPSAKAASPPPPARSKSKGTAKSKSVKGKSALQKTLDEATDLVYDDPFQEEEPLAQSGPPAWTPSTKSLPISASWERIVDEQKQNPTPPPYSFNLQNPVVPEWSYFEGRHEIWHRDWNKARGRRGVDIPRLVGYTVEYGPIKNRSVITVTSPEDWRQILEGLKNQASIKELKITATLVCDGQKEAPPPSEPPANKSLPATVRSTPLPGGVFATSEAVALTDEAMVISPIPQWAKGPNGHVSFPCHPNPLHFANADGDDKMMSAVALARKEILLKWRCSKENCTNFNNVCWVGRDTTHYVVSLPRQKHWAELCNRRYGVDQFHPPTEWVNWWTVGKNDIAGTKLTGKKKVQDIPPLTTGSSSAPITINFSSNTPSIQPLSTEQQLQQLLQLQYHFQGETSSIRPSIEQPLLPRMPTPGRAYTVEPSSSESRSYDLPVRQSSPLKEADEPGHTWVDIWRDFEAWIQKIKPGRDVFWTEQIQKITDEFLTLEEFIRLPRDQAKELGFAYAAVSGIQDNISAYKRYRKHKDEQGGRGKRDSCEHGNGPYQTNGTRGYRGLYGSRGASYARGRGRRVRPIYATTLYGQDLRAFCLRNHSQQAGSTLAILSFK